MWLSDKSFGAMRRAVCAARAYRGGFFARLTALRRMLLQRKKIFALDARKPRLDGPAKAKTRESVLTDSFWRIVEEAVSISRSRMGVECLDLLQFHWWDYSDESYLEALAHLADLRREGKIRHLALTNFDTERLRLIADHGVTIVSNQVQYSLVDRRPEVRMAAFCREHGMTLLAYGTLLGGLLSEKYLGRPEPPRAELNAVVKRLR